MGFEREMWVSRRAPGTCAGHGVCGIRLALAAAVLLFAAPAHALAPDRDDSPAAEGLGTGPRDRLAAEGLVLAGPWPAAAVTALAEALHGLDPWLRPAPDAPLEVTWADEPRPYGHDGLSAEGRLRLAQYAPGPVRIGAGLAGLPPADQVRLWRRRALVHAVLARWDRDGALSDTERWRGAADWSSPLLGAKSPLNTWIGAFSRPEGHRSPRDDLLTFAEEALAPASAVHPGFDPDAEVRCRQPSKWQALVDVLVEAGRVPAPPPRGPCPALDRWLSEETLAGLEVLWVAPSGRALESLFGHLMLRPIRHEGLRVRAPGLETVVQLVALTDPADRGLGYAWKGLSGGYPMVVLTTPFGAIRHGVLRREARTIRRFRLQLTRREQVRVLERAWELERHGYYAYRFFTENCATLLARLLHGALGPGAAIPVPGFPYAPPGATLDALTRVHRADGGEPLLRYVPDDLPSGFDEAAGAHRRRETLRDGLPPALRVLHEATLAPRPEVRARAYRRLPAAVAGALSRGASREEVYTWVALTVGLERYAVERADAETEARAEARLRAAAAAVEAERRAACRAASGAGQDGRGAARDGREAEPEGCGALSGESAQDPVVIRRATLARDRDLVERAAWIVPPGPFASPEDASAELRATEAAFEAAVRAQGLIVDRHFSEVDAAAALAADAAAARVETTRWAASAIPRSGAGRVAFGVGTTLSADGVVPALVVRGALLSARLGEPLLHAVRPETEVRILDGELRLGIGFAGTGGAGTGDAGARLGVVGSKVTILAFRSVSRDVPALRRSPLGPLGWGAGLHHERAPTPAELGRYTADAELLWIAALTPRATAFTALGLGGEAQLGTLPGGGLEPALAPRATLTHRAPLLLPAAGALRLEAAMTPALRWSARGPKLGAEARLAAALDVQLGPAAGRWVLVGLEANVTWRAGGDFGLQPVLDLVIRVDLL